jgi:Helix-turn-helix
MSSTQERERKRRKTDAVPLSKRAEELKENIAEEKDLIAEQIKAILSRYETIASEVDGIVEDSKKHEVRDVDETFSETVQGLKGTGIQKSNALQTIRQMRLARGLTLRALSEELDIPYPHLSEIERGLRFPLDEERAVIEKWAGGQLNFRFVPYVLIRPIKGE